MSNTVPTSKEASASIMSDQKSLYSTTPLVGDNDKTANSNKSSRGLDGFLHKLREEDRERKAGQVEYISYDEANKRTGYDQKGYPNEEKQKEKEGKNKGDKRLGAGLFIF